MARYNKLIILALVAMIGIPNTIYAQFKDYISVRENTIRQDGNALTVDMDIQLINPDISNDGYLMITPAFITPDGDTFPMQEIIVTGSMRQKRYNRYLDGNLPLQDAYTVVETPGKQKSLTIPYRTSVPNRNWMESAEVVLIAENCGCGSEVKQREIIPVTTLNAPEPARYAVSFIVPPEEEIKAREISGEAYVIFPVNKTTLIPDLAENSSELMKIRQSVDYVREVDQIEITAITIEAYASPEGALNHNIELSEGRAAALKNYVMSHYNLPASLFTVRSKGENWEGLEEAIRNSDFTENEKSDLLNILDIDDLNTRKSRLKGYNGGRTYQYLLTHIYPRLRRSDYRIEYVVPAFSVEQGKELLYTKPAMLSLNEMYLIANSYDQSSDEFKDVFDVAVRIYPQDPIANINAAAIELERNSPERAANYLSGGMDREEAYNNIGVMYALQNNLTEAERYFRMAAERGSTEAAENLEQLTKTKVNQQYSNP